MAPKGFMDRQIAHYSVMIMQESTVSQCFQVRPEVAVMNGQQREQQNKKYSRSVLNIDIGYPSSVPRREVTVCFSPMSMVLNSTCIERHSIHLPFLIRQQKLTNIKPRFKE